LDTFPTVSTGSFVNGDIESGGVRLTGVTLSGVTADGSTGAVTVTGTIGGENATAVTTGNGYVSLTNSTDAKTNSANLKWALGKAGEDAIIKLTLAQPGTLDANASVPEGLELTVTETATLTVGSGKTLDIKGTLDMNGTLTVDSAGTLNGSGTGKIVFGEEATVTGTTFHNAGETAMTDVAGVAYEWTTDAGGTNGRWREASQDISNIYKLADSDGDIPTIGNIRNLTHTAKQSNADRTIYVKVSGILTGVSNFNDNPLWGDIGWTGATGKWADMAFDDSADLVAHANKALAIRSTSFSYYYYKDSALTKAPGRPMLHANGENDIYVPAVDMPTSSTDIPVKWRLYMEIAKIAKIVIDYSGVISTSLS
jgi:hypothetical protein